MSLLLAIVFTLSALFVMAPLLPKDRSVPSPRLSPEDAG